MNNLEIWERPDFILAIRPSPSQQEFILKCGTREQAEYIAKAVKCYQQYDSVVSHLEYAVSKVKEIGTA